MNFEGQRGSEITFKVADEFSSLPGGRRRIHGPHSGEEFREDHLVPLLRRFEFVNFDLSGAEGYASGFLDEAFGEAGTLIGYAECERRLKFEADDDPFVVDMIWEKIKNASDESQA